MAIQQRRTGWLSPSFHADFREVLVHTTARFHLVCPVYCLMPDHAHLLLLGLSDECDQQLAVRFLRRYTASQLKPAEWQRQPYDHVLRREERERGALAAVAAYILENPVRAGLCAERGDWEFSGCVVAGYPELEVRASDFWERFWKIYDRVANDV